MFCFSSPIKAVIGRYVMWIKKGKYAEKFDENLLNEQIIDINKLK